MTFAKKHENIRLGIIGMNEGNGHPYSWSAIFNGYNQEKMTRECPYAGIPEYLNKEPKESLQITGANVTHIYCDKRKDAEHVAACSLIPNVVDRPEDMIGQVDAVIIATDIANRHVEQARIFVEAEMPIFIDKPLCNNVADLATFRKWVIDEKRPIMSSSASRYTKECLPYYQSTNDFGELRYISTSMCKKWETYGIHALETIYPIAGPGFKTIQNVGTYERNIVHMTHERGIDIMVAVINDLQHAGDICLTGTKGKAYISRNDTFFAFKSQLQAFVDFLRTKQYPFPFSETEELMKLVIGGIASRENNGVKIHL